MEYKVKITETTERYVVIVADDLCEAEEKAEELANEGVFDSFQFDSYSRECTATEADEKEAKHFKAFGIYYE